MNIRKRFTKDYSIPIPVTASPHWEHFVDLFDPFYGVREKLQMLEDGIASLGMDGFFSHLRLVEESIVRDVSAKPAYDRLAKDKLEDYEIGSNPFASQQLYCRENVGKTILSIDLVTANFFALRHYDPSLVGEAEDFQAFLDEYNPLDYVRGSKRLRQYVFGNLLPKKQQKISRFLVHQQMLEAAKNIPLERIRYFSSDEFYVIGTAEQIEADRQLFHVDPNRVRLSVFTIEPIGIGFVKREAGKPPKIKGVPGYQLAETIRLLMGQPPQAEDRFFTHENRVAQYQTPLW